jgi:AcrR family transcriptional regulator
MKKKWEERKVESPIRDELLVKQKREEIIEAASKVFAQKGYHQATIRDISKVSGLGPGTIYNYVRKKEDILYLIYSKLTTGLTESLLEAIENHSDPIRQLKKTLIRTIDMAWDNQDLILLMYQETGALDKESMYNILERESNYVDYMQKILEGAKKRGIIENKNTRLAADIIVYLLAFIPLRRWNLKKRFDEKQIKNGLIEFILKGLFLTGGGRRKS